jgi:hypothetical protein
MTPERLAEIRATLAAVTTDRPNSYAERDRARDRWEVCCEVFAAELLAEVARLTPRQITTVAELEALPMYAVVTDPDGDAWQKRYDDDQPWVMAGLASEPEADQTLLTYAPLLLVHTPQAQAENTA